MKREFEPELRTDPEHFCKEEHNKRRSPWLIGALDEELRDGKPDLAWESEQIAKSHGIYLAFDRAKTGREKDWMYMIRVANPGGGPISPGQWRLFDELAERHARDREGHASVRLTTRQAIQLHWIEKPAVIEVVRALAESGMHTLNACGDNTRNVMACPLGRGSEVYDPHRLARHAGSYFQLPIEPYIKIFAIDPNQVRQPDESFGYGPGLLNRKFKIAFSAVHRDPQTGGLVPDNCVEALTNDLGVVPVVSGGRVQAFQIYVGGGQGERNNKPTLATLAVPLTVVSEDELHPTLDAIVRVHQQWGDRKNRHWARLKYVIRKQGVDWFREQVGALLGRRLPLPDPDLSVGDRQLHHGWAQQGAGDSWSFGAFIENGRVIDASPNGRLKTMVRRITEILPVQLMVTPNQDLVFADVPHDAREVLEGELQAHAYGSRAGRPYSALRRQSGACVGRDTCRLTYTDSEKFEPELIDELERRGWGDVCESIGITGCERQCFRPATKTIGLIGSGLNQYQLKLFGDVSARFQGRPLVSEDGEQMYLRAIPRVRVADVVETIFRQHREGREAGEGLGAFLRRQGADRLIALLKAEPTTGDLMAARPSAGLARR